MEMSSGEEAAPPPVHPPRPRPNVLVTGTPGTGKSSTAELLVDILGAGFTRVVVGDLVREHHFFDELDPVHGAMLIDEDRLLDYMEELLAPGGVVVEHHGSELFPERWFDLVAVLRCDNTLLFDRLAARGYSQAKIQENVECEIMGVVEEEARASYKDGIIMLLESNSAEQLQHNASAIAARARELIK